MENIKRIRDKNVIRKSIQQTKDSWIALNDIKIVFPVNYEERGLAEITDTVITVGICAIISGSAYAVINVLTSIKFSPSEVIVIKENDESYYEMSFEKGSTIVPNINCVKNDGLPYLIYDLFISKGKVPWYMDYADICNLFNTARSYANANVGQRPEVIQLMASLIARDKEDRTRYYRQILDKNKDLSNRLVFIPIRSVEYGATNTTNKLAGAYFSKGVVSSLLNPTEKVENIEEILRY